MTEKIFQFYQEKKSTNCFLFMILPGLGLIINYFKPGSPSIFNDLNQYGTMIRKNMIKGG